MLLDAGNLEKRRCSLSLALTMLQGRMVVLNVQATHSLTKIGILYTFIAVYIITGYIYLARSGDALYFRMLDQVCKA